MKKALALFWGLLTILPFIFMIYFTSTLLGYFPPEFGDDDGASFERAWRLGMVTNVLMFLLIVSYIVYLFKTSHVPKDKKALWAVVLFLGHVISMPVFWYIYVWSPLRSRDREVERIA